MRNKYIDLIDQTFFFPQDEFKLNKKHELMFHDIDVSEIIKEHGTPLKITYLPKISENIQKTQKWFQNAFEKHNYQGKYFYSYCTKSSHFKHILDEALKNNIHIETSSAFDINIVNALVQSGKINKDTFVICNGFKREQYISNIADLINNKHKNCVPIIDNYEELSLLEEEINGKFSVGIRIASEEEPKFEFYTSRLGIGYKNIVPFYKKQIEDNPNVDLKMLHFFINTGIKDNAYYWNELHKCLKVYTALKKICPTLDSLNIGGGFPIKTSLAFDYDYEYMIDEIVNQINTVCRDEGVETPHLFTEFGSFTVGESGANFYKVLYQKQQNDRELWNMIDSSFITTLPDSWAINKRFIMLPINRWNESYERVLLGGLTCDSDDYYNSEQHSNAIYLPTYDPEEPLYIGFFNTGAYQESIGGFGGLQHCLIPQPKQLILNKNEDGTITTTVFREKQTHQEFLNILGYEN
ncbi:arginine decarboxylase [Wenyingzhuangia sp. 2_MG-2023]|uniref:arginine decarboxylase n=1 Tax=Wenyingzhuangia sp. 2_MG-2023 TaxID=3062639 RepID=UPI0026E17477|nr:arginine decarboxylase [Wenyingzhuangia sp. 2_MG-2023]MDO6738765.1 arginine decarboxylase [Wenyingzhuangia sp. 2_MG-2023]MDO6801986.1 arginine decarboxylase [Wenyingzhuangia sp. 1_MG-2023]